MLHLTKAIAATALGLMISLSLCTPGAFAQSIQQGTTNNTTVTQTIGHGNNYRITVARTTIIVVIITRITVARTTIIIETIVSDM